MLVRSWSVVLGLLVLSSAVLGFRGSFRELERRRFGDAERRREFADQERRRAHLAEYADNSDIKKPQADKRNDTASNQVLDSSSAETFASFQSLTDSSAGALASFAELFGASKANPEAPKNFKTYVVTKKVPVPYPVQYETRFPYPVKVPVRRPYAVYVPKPYYFDLPKPVPFPVKVPMPQPYHVEKHVHYPFKIPVDKPIPYHIPKPYPVYIEKKIPVPVPVEKPYLPNTLDALESFKGDKSVHHLFQIQNQNPFLFSGEKPSIDGTTTYEIDIKNQKPHFISAESLKLPLAENQDFSTHISPNSEIASHFSSSNDFTTQQKTGNDFNNQLNFNHDFATHLQSTNGYTPQQPESNKIAAQIKANNDYAAQIKANDELSAHLKLNNDFISQLKANHELAAQLTANHDYATQVKTNYDYSSNQKTTNDFTPSPYDALTSTLLSDGKEPVYSFVPGGHQNNIIRTPKQGYSFELPLNSNAQDTYKWAGINTTDWIPKSGTSVQSKSIHDQKQETKIPDEQKPPHFETKDFQQNYNQGTQSGNSQIKLYNFIPLPPQLNQENIQTPSMPFKISPSGNQQTEGGINYQFFNVHPHGAKVGDEGSAVSFQKFQAEPKSSVEPPTQWLQVPPNPHSNNNFQQAQGSQQTNAYEHEHQRQLPNFPQSTSNFVTKQGIGTLKQHQLSAQQNGNTPQSSSSSQFSPQYSQEAINEQHEVMKLQNRPDLNSFNGQNFPQLQQYQQQIVSQPQKYQGPNNNQQFQFQSNNYQNQQPPFEQQRNTYQNNQQQNQFNQQVQQQTFNSPQTDHYPQEGQYHIQKVTPPRQFQNKFEQKGEGDYRNFQDGLRRQQSRSPNTPAAQSDQLLRINVDPISSPDQASTPSPNTQTPKPRKSRRRQRKRTNVNGETTTPTSVTPAL